jgi:hypothetical protein
MGMREKTDELVIFVCIYHFGRIYYTFSSLMICTTYQMPSLI